MINKLKAIREETQPVSVDRPWYPVLAATDYLDILLQTLAIGRTDDIRGL